MSMSDPLGDMLTRIRNAQRAKKSEVVSPASRLRENVLEVLKKEGCKVSERLLSIDELAKAMQDGTLEEAWGCGTAAVVSPIGELCYKGVKYPVNNGEIGATTQMLYDTLTGIQWGKIEDTFGWTESL